MRPEHHRLAFSSESVRHSPFLSAHATLWFLFSLQENPLFPTVQSLLFIVCQPTEIWGVLAGLPSEALGHSEWETKSERNDLFPAEQQDRAESWEAKGFNQINVPFVISLSALSVCVSVCPFVDCLFSASIFCVSFIYLSSVLSACLSICLIG